MDLEGHTCKVLGFEVDKPSKILIKTLNVTKYLELNIQNIGRTRINSHII